MKKRKILATALAGAIAINTLGGCSDKNTLTNSSKNDVIETTVDELISQLNITKSVVDEQNSQAEKLDKLIAQLDIKENLVDTQTPQIEFIELPIDENLEEYSYINGCQIIERNAKVITIEASYNEENNTYYLPPSDISGAFILVGDLCYKVEIEETYQYPAIKEEVDGNIIYRASYGGTLLGTQATFKRTIPLDAANVRSFLEEYNYINNNILELKLPFEHLK